MKKLGLSVLLVFFVASVATADITWYTDQATFEAAAIAAGLSPFEFEDFEECELPPKSVVAMDDPLAPGVPNGPFPAGLTGVSDMIVQSNTLGGDPFEPSPRGVDGLAAATEGFLGATSDVVLANTFVDSLDLDFDDGAEKPAVGFNTLSFLGANEVQVRAYGASDPNGVEPFLGMTTVGANPQGTYFVGVICTDRSEVGRISIFDMGGGAGGGAEGGDNIQTWIRKPECPGDVDGDGDTDHSDLGELLAAWCTQEGDPNWNPNADLDGDGHVGHSDLGILLADWGCGT